MTERAKRDVPPLELPRRPRLSVTLDGPIAPNLCRSCGAAHHEGNPLTRRLECDEWDQLPKKPAAIVLCEQCTQQLIASQPRLYEQLLAGAPFDGCIPALGANDWD